MKAKKYHDLSDNYVLFMVLLVVIISILVLVRPTAEKSKPKNSSIENLNQ